MRTHNGEKPFICKEKNCGKKFTTAGNLKNHRRIHTGEKPFLCEADGCGRSFAEYSSLRKHVLVHSGEKPHVCGICGKTFSQSGSRNVHMRKRHGEEVHGGDGRETDLWLLHITIFCGINITNSSNNCVSFSDYSGQIFLPEEKLLDVEF
uniref:Zinc finger protein 410 n=1 Tax=Nothobranchius korthausae TaxID=1143690 RepID=A0A1A8ER29_9TELE